MNDSPLISIMVPVYNTEKYLRQCLTSLCTQTYHNIEIIIVNDGSEDKSASICEEFAHNDNRIFLIHQKNQGMSSARNEALRNAHGDFLMYVDSDDWVEPDFCESALNCLQENQAKLAVFCYEVFYSEDNRRDSHIRLPQVIDSSITMEYLIRDKYIHNLLWNKIFSRELFSGIEFPTGRCFEENLIICELIHRAGRISVTPKVLYHYRQRNTSVSSKWYSPKCIKDRFQLRKERRVLFKENYPELVEKQITGLSRDAVFALTFNRGEKYKDFRDEVKEFLSSNKQIILKNSNDKLVKLYYRCSFIMPIVLRIRDLFRR